MYLTSHECSQQNVIMILCTSASPHDFLLIFIFFTLKYKDYYFKGIATYEMAPLVYAMKQKQDTGQLVCCNMKCLEMCVDSLS